MGCGSSSDQSSQASTLTIKMLTGKVFKVPVTANDTVLSVKEKIRATEGLEHNEQVLLFGGTQLEEDKTLAECGVTPGATVHLVKRDPARSAPKPLGRATEALLDKHAHVLDNALTIKMLSGKMFQVPVTSFDTVLSVKEKIRATEGLECNEQRLLFGGVQLEDDKTLAECGVTPGATVHLVKRLPVMCAPVPLGRATQALLDKHGHLAQNDANKPSTTTAAAQPMHGNGTTPLQRNQQPSLY